MDNFTVGTIIEGVVLSIKKFGVFLSFDYNYVGLLHISEISNEFIDSPFNYFNKGDKITVLVKKIDNSNKTLNVSIKDLPNRNNNISNKTYNKKNELSIYIRDIDFTKLDRSLKNMVKNELLRIKGE
ncbi:MAG: S1 RNA-binding domain-containing protein [Bacillales bacterium]